MPVFMYKAMTKNGTIVKNRVEDINKYALIQKLKRNDLTPIDIIQSKSTVKKQLHKTENTPPVLTFRSHSAIISLGNLIFK